MVFVRVVRHFCIELMSSCVGNTKADTLYGKGVAVHTNIRLAIAHTSLHVVIAMQYRALGVSFGRTSVSCAEFFLTGHMAMCV